MSLRALAKQVLEQGRYDAPSCLPPLALVPCFSPYRGGTVEQKHKPIEKPSISCSKGLEQKTVDWNKPYSGTWAERAAIIEANGVPREWAEGFATLCTMSRPTGYTPQRWQQIVDDGGRFLDSWGRQAAGLGWKALDVFGVNPDAPECRYDGMGLVPLIEGRKVAAITANTARLLCHDGAALTYCRNSTNLFSVAIWNLK